MPPCHIFASRVVRFPVLVAVLLVLGFSLSVTAKPYTEDEAALYLHIISKEFPGCLIRNGAFRAESVASVVAQSAVECQDRCIENQHCDAFTYYPSSSSCILTAHANPGSFVTMEGAWSGPKLCRNECKEEGFVVGPTVRVIVDGSVTTLDECLEWCETSVQCAFATFDYRDGVCYLVGQKQGETRKKRGAVSVSKRCVHKDASVIEGMKVAGTEIGEPATALSWQECRVRGEATPSATFWHWDSATTACRLVGGTNAGALKPKEGSFAGPVWWSKGHCFLEDIKVSAEPATTELALSARDCQQRCERKRRCSFFSFTDMSGTCILLEGTPKEVSIDIAPGWKAGPPFCFPQDWCVLPAVVYMGTALETLTQRDAVQCRQSCRAHSGCEVWWFDRSTFTCSLMANEALSRVAFNTHYTSGLASCGSQAACRNEDRDYGESRYLEDIQDVSGADECQQRCYEQPRCFFYALLPSGTCRLYPNNMEPHPSLGSTAGPAKC